MLISTTTTKSPNVAWVGMGCTIKYLSFCQDSRTPNRFLAGTSFGFNWWFKFIQTADFPPITSSIFLVWKEGLHDQGPVNATASLQAPLCNLLSYRILISSATGIDTAVVLAYHYQVPSTQKLVPFVFVQSYRNALIQFCDKGGMAPFVTMEP